MDEAKNQTFPTDVPEPAEAAKESEAIEMQHTGERMIPGASDWETFWEHIYRYRFARRYVAGKRVLDIACGEGYGTAALSRAGASTCVGVDVSPETCRHAARKYGVDARVGSAEEIPLPAESVDVVVSFETIEHVSSPKRFIAECHRVLAPGGTLVLSTPNKGVYAHDYVNPYHVSEMTEVEARSLLGEHFKEQAVFAQRPHVTASLWAFTTAADGIVQQWGRRVENFLYRAGNRVGRSTRRLSPQWQEQPVDAILSPGRGPSFFDPYRVRPRSSFKFLPPNYLILVSTKPG